eukprot:gene3162-3631_t
MPELTSSFYNPKVELEKLNAATDGINHLETEYGEAQALFRQMVAEAIGTLEFTAKKIGSQNIAKARPYFDGLKQLRKAGYNLHQAAIFYEMAQNHHAAAKKRVASAESKAFSDTSGKLDPALQELLNQTTIELMETIRQKTESSQKHQECAKIFNEKQAEIEKIKKSHHKTIDKAKPYFELKFRLNKSLEQQKERVAKIQQGISFAKEQYAITLRKLELISDDIHRSRKIKEDLSLLVSQPREEGVGAESGSEEEVSVPAGYLTPNRETVDESESHEASLNNVPFGLSKSCENFKKTAPEDNVTLTRTLSLPNQLSPSDSEQV